MPINREHVELQNKALEHWHDYHQSGNPEHLKKTNEALDQIDELKINPLRKLFRFVTGL